MQRNRAMLHIINLHANEATTQGTVFIPVCTCVRGCVCLSARKRKKLLLINWCTLEAIGFMVNPICN